MRVLSIFGTRPEAIKLAPVILLLGGLRGQIESTVCVTAQHREMLDQILDLFGIQPDVDLNLMEPNQSLASFTGRAVQAVSDTLDKIKPDLILVQGDTTTAMLGGLAGHYHKIPVGHVEAGLRTHSRYNPFPEEMNRRLLGVLAAWHFAPTEAAKKALENEGISKKNIFLTGNPVIDALKWVLRNSTSEGAEKFLASLGPFEDGKSSSPKKILLVTAHRRESFGEPLARVCQALRSLALNNPEIEIVFPVHRNPNVQKTVFGVLSDEPRIHLVNALPYETMAHLMDRSYLILTDSGGLQEEGPALGKPVLVLRDETERPEGIEAGTAKLVGTDPKLIITETERLLRDDNAYRKMAAAVSPYGDGHAADRIVRIIQENEIA